MLEAQLTRQYVRLQGSLGHQQPDQIEPVWQGDVAVGQIDS